MIKKNDQYELKVLYKKNTIPKWKHKKLWTECSKQEQLEANLRTLWPDEIVLDFESEQELLNNLSIISKYNCKVFFSGSRGYHVHLNFDELKQYSADIRNKIRKIFLTQFFGADPCTASENRLISIEGKPHHKTGNLKIEYARKELPYPNKIPLWIIKEATKPVEFCQTNEQNGGGMQRFINDPLINFLMGLEKKIGKLPGVSRHFDLTKNIGALACICCLTEDEAHQISHSICMEKIEGRNPNEIFVWYNWMKRRLENEGKQPFYNRRAVIRFLGAIPA